MKRILFAMLLASLSVAACGGGGADEHVPVAQATQGVSRVSGTVGGTPVQADNANGGTIAIGQQEETNNVVDDAGRVGTFFDVAPKGAAQTICRGVGFQPPPQVPGGPVAKPPENIFAEVTSVDSTKKIGTMTWMVEHPQAIDLTKVFADGKLRYSDGIDGHSEKVIVSASTITVVFEQIPLSRGGTLFGLTAEDAPPGSFRLMLSHIVYKDGTKAPIGAGTSTMTTVRKCA